MKEKTYAARTEANPSHGGSTRRQGHLGRFARLRLRFGNCRPLGHIGAVL
jgi:hypothetical protein